jgi:hypothetical protein
MVYEERVEKVPYQVCRMVAEQQTIRVPRVVEKRIPVTYTCNVPRLVCYRVPLDACGNPISEGSMSVAAPAEAHLQQPTPAKKATGADVKPELGPSTTAPRPIDADEKPMKAVPQPASPAAPSVYPSKRT